MPTRHLFAKTNCNKTLLPVFLSVSKKLMSIFNGFEIIAYV